MYKVILKETSFFFCLFLAVILSRFIKVSDYLIGDAVMVLCLPDWANAICTRAKSRNQVNIYPLVHVIYIWQCLSCYFIPKNWISYAGAFILFCFMAKTAFRRIWIIYFSFSKTSVFPHMMLLLMYCRYSGDSPWSSAVWVSSWKIVKLYFYPWGSQFHVYWMLLQVKANCGLHSAARKTKALQTQYCLNFLAFMLELEFCLFLK